MTKTRLTRLLTIVVLLITLIILLVPSVVYAKDPIKLDPGLQLIEDADNYDVYFNDRTKRYKFIKNTTLPWV